MVGRPELTSKLIYSVDNCDGRRQEPATRFAILRPLRPALDAPMSYLKRGGNFGWQPWTSTAPTAEDTLSRKFPAHPWPPSHA